MKNNLKFIFAFLFLLGDIFIVSAQDVYIQLPTNNLFNRSEYIRVESIMSTQGNKSWRALPGKNPHIRSTSGDYFKHTSKSNTLLPSSVLHWRLANIGGEHPPFHSRDDWPGYKWFNSSFQTWYQPYSSAGRYNSGDVEFTFMIPPSEMANNAFHAGKYKIDIQQDYGRSGWYAIEFSPENFNLYIDISEAIEWLLRPGDKLFEITSLHQFRPTNSQILISLGPIEVGHTIDFNLYAKANDRNIKFKSSSRNNRSNRQIDVGVVKLGSNNPKIEISPLTSNWKNHSTNGDFTVEPGNRTSFELQLSISNEDFKTHFFEAGTYSFELEVGARGTEHSKKSEKDMDVTIVVPALSEISLPGGNTEVNFVFNNMIQYNEGQSKTIPNQIRVSNNENYELYVKSSTNYFSSNGLQTDLNASILEVGVEGNSENVTLSKNSQKIIKNGIPAIDESLNITYTISPSAAQTLIPKEKKSYDISVIYSFTAL